MEDKELYNYFRSRKDSFNSKPAEQLWGKIEAGLNTPAPIAPKPLWLKSWIVFPVISACAIATTLYISRSTETRTETKKTTPVEDVNMIQSNIKADDENEPSVDNEIQTSGPLTTDTVRKKKPLVILQKNKEAVSSENNHESKIAPANMTVNEQPVGIMDTIGFNMGNLTTETIISNGRIVVTTKEKLTDSQFKALTNELIKENGEATGSTLIVKAPGHSVFRYIIKTPENTYTTSQRDSVVKAPDHVKPKTKKSSKKEFTIKSTQDTLKNYIEFTEF